MGILLRRILISLVLPFAWRKWREHRATKRAARAPSRYADSTA
jgi:hypothetical protein